GGLMPAVPKTSDEEVLRAARRLVERAGPEALSMQAIADAVGVRAPSLYKRFPDRDALLDGVTRLALADLAARLDEAGRGRAPRAAVAAMARNFRAFALRSPGLFALLFAARSESAGLLAARREAVAPLIEAISPLVAPEDRLSAARLLTAFLHGFVSMEL